MANYWRALTTTFGNKLTHIFPAGFTSKYSQAFFTKIVKETVEYREKNNVDRPDMLNMLIQLKNKGFVAPDKELDSQDERHEGNKRWAAYLQGGALR